MHRWAVVGFVVLGGLLTAAPARAETYRVTSTGDSGGCEGTTCGSIRAALAAANANPGPDTVRVPAGTYPIRSAFQVVSDVSIIGERAETTFISVIANTRAFEVSSGVTATISHLQAGDQPNAANNIVRYGGLVHNAGTLTLDYVGLGFGRASSEEAWRTRAGRSRSTTRG